MTPPPRAPIVQERVVRASPEAVFRAWSDPESLGRWMCPSPEMRPASVEVDFRVGGRFRIVMHGEERDYEHVGRYLTIEPPRRLVFSWISTFIPAPHSTTRVTVSIEPVGEFECRIQLVHDELPDGDHYDGHAEGWAEILRKLAREVAATGGGARHFEPTGGVTPMIARLASESPEYAKLRDELQQAEVALRDQRERVAALRRQLPRNTTVEDSTLLEIRDGAPAEVRLGELFVDPAKPLILLHFMYGKAQTNPCPMCTSWADGYDGVVPHLLQRANFAVFVAGDPGAFGEYARSRGWRNLRIVSAGQSDLKRALGFETPEGGQNPGLSVFERSPDGTLIHFYSQSADLGSDGFRGMDLLNPLWHFFDALPEGRGDFFPRKSYD